MNALDQTYRFLLADRSLDSTRRDEAVAAFITRYGQIDRNNTLRLTR